MFEWLREQHYFSLSLKLWKYYTEPELWLFQPYTVLLLLFSCVKASTGQNSSVKCMSSTLFKSWLWVCEGTLSVLTNNPVCRHDHDFFLFLLPNTCPASISVQPRSQGLSSFPSKATRWEIPGRTFSVLILIKWHYEQFPCFPVGTNRATLVKMNVFHPVGIVVFGDYVYWIDRESRAVMKIKKRGELLGSAVQAAVDDLSDMIVVDARKSTGRDIILILILTVNFEFLITCLHTGLVGIVGRIMFVEIG